VVEVIEDLEYFHLGVYYCVQLVWEPLLTYMSTARGTREEGGGGRYSNDRRPPSRCRVSSLLDNVLAGKIPVTPAEVADLIQGVEVECFFQLVL